MEVDGDMEVASIKMKTSSIKKHKTHPFVLVITTINVIAMTTTMTATTIIYSFVYFPHPNLSGAGSLGSFWLRVPSSLKAEVSLRPERRMTQGVRVS